MNNKIIIDIMPVDIADLHKGSLAWNLKQSMAELDMELARRTIINKIECEIPVEFNCDIRLILSFNVNTGMIAIDYSKITCGKTINILRTYLDAYAYLYVEEWSKNFSSN